MERVVVKTLNRMKLIWLEVGSFSAPFKSKKLMEGNQRGLYEGWIARLFSFTVVQLHGGSVTVVQLLGVQIHGGSVAMNRSCVGMASHAPPA